MANHPLKGIIGEQPEIPEPVVITLRDDQLLGRKKAQKAQSAKRRKSFARMQKK